MVGRIELYKHITTIIQSQMKFLLELGYVTSKIDYNVKNEYTTIPFLQIVFLLPGKRCITFEFHNLRYLSVDIENKCNLLINNKTFSLKNYYYNTTESRNGFVLSDYNGTLENKITLLVCFVKDILQNKLLAVVKGDEWINVSWDWCGAK